MSGGSKQQTVGYRYLLGLHLGICQGPVDALLAIKVGDRVAWQGNVTESDSIEIDAPSLLGGDEREGGVKGTLDVMMGEDDQAPNSYLTSVQGGLQSAYRGLLSLVFRRGMVSANNPYVKPWAPRVRRILKGWHNDAPWYPEKAEVPLSMGADSIKPWLEETDPRDPAGLYEYRWSTDDGWRASLDEAIADAVADGVSETRFTLMVGWSLDKVRIFDAYHDDPSAATSLHLHFNVGPVDSSIGYVGTIAQQEDGGDFCGEYKDLGVGVGGGRFWWSGLTTDGPEDGIYLAGLHRLVAGGTTLDPGEVGLNNCTNYPESPTTSLFPIAAFMADKTIEVRRVERVIVAMNPAHIIYQCLTDPEWGMGYSSAIINSDSFEAAADTFHAEGMGLCLHWTQQAPIEQFIQTVADHAGAILRQDPSTGLFVLKPIRADYDPDTLPVLDASSITSLDGYARSGSPDSVNEVTVKYDDALTGRQGSVTVQNTAVIAAVGGIVTQGKNYPGLPIADLALRVALRDLRVSSSNLARVRLSVNRKGFRLLPGDVFKLNWPKLGLTGLILRVLRVNTGTLTSSSIEIECAEDVFGLGSSTYTKQQPIGWQEASARPAPSPYRLIVEAPYYELQRSLTAGDLAALSGDEGWLFAAAAKPPKGALNFNIATRQTGSGEPLAVSTPGDFAPVGLLSAGIDPTDTSITLGSIQGADQIAAGGYAVIGIPPSFEIVRIDAFDAGTGVATIGRGVMDTVAKSHASGEQVLFCADFSATDQVERIDGESIDVAILPRTGFGLLNPTSAPVNVLEFDQRAYRPYPPGQMLIDGTAYPATVNNPLTLEWSHRNRLQQNLEGDESGDIGPEDGVTYSVELRNAVTDALLRSASGITGTSYAPANLSGVASLRVLLWAVRDGLPSMQRHDWTITYNPPAIAPGATITAHASMIGGGATNGDAVAPGALILGPAASFSRGSAYAQSASDVLLLAHCDGADAATTFIDSSIYARTLAANGAAKLSTTAPKFGSAAASLPGIGDFVTVGATGAVAVDLQSFMTSDFTLEAWVKIPSGYGTRRTLFSVERLYGDSSISGFTFEIDNVRQPTIRRNGVLLSYERRGFEVPVDEWCHVAWSQRAGQLRMFVGGKNVISGFAGISRDWVEGGGLADSGSTARIGSGLQVTIPVDAFDEMRLAKFAAYVDDFTPPVDPFGAEAEVLLHFDGSNGSTVLTDSSGNGYAVTSAGAACSLTTSEKKWGTASLNLSGAAGGYATFALTSMPSQMTIECWVRPTSNGYRFFFALSPDPGGLAINSSGKLAYDDGTSIPGTTTMTLNTWHHIAMVVDGTNRRAYLNGILEASASGRPTISGSVTAAIGASSSSGNDRIIGQIDDFRLTYGEVLYNANFTPPTGPFPNPT